MSKLDLELIKMTNKVLDGKEEKLGDYIDPTKQQIKSLMLELIGEATTHELGNFTLEELDKLENAATYAVAQDALRAKLRQKVSEL